MCLCCNMGMDLPKYLKSLKKMDTILFSNKEWMVLDLANVSISKNPRTTKIQKLKCVWCRKWSRYT